MSTEGTAPNQGSAAPAPAAAAAAAPNSAAPEAPGSAPAAPAAPDFRTTIPEAFREKPWARDLKSAEDAFKMLDGAQTLLGKQGKIVPLPDAPKEEWDKFYQAAGRPESPDKYEFVREQGVEYDAEWDTSLKGALFEAGITSKQLSVLGPKFDSLIAAQIAKEKSQGEAQFQALSSKVFGADAQKHIDESTKLMNAIVPPEARELISLLDNNGLILLASVMKEVGAKYIGEDKTRLIGDGGQGHGALSDDARKAKAHEIRSSPEFRDQFHPGHSAKKAELDRLYQGIK